MTKNQISKFIFETIKDKDMTSDILLTAITNEVHRQIRNAIIQNMLTDTISIDWKTLSKELGIADPNNIDGMIAVLENEVILEMSKGHLLPDYFSTNKPKTKIEETRNPQRWVYLAD
jgi:hypothetical protein